MGANLIRNQKENWPKTQQKIYYDTGQTPVLYPYNRKTPSSFFCEDFRIQQSIYPDVC